MYIYIYFCRWTNIQIGLCVRTFTQLNRERKSTQTTKYAKTFSQTYEQQQQQQQQHIRNMHTKIVSENIQHTYIYAMYIAYEMKWHSMWYDMIRLTRKDHSFSSCMYVYRERTWYHVQMCVVVFFSLHIHIHVYKYVMKKEPSIRLEYIYIYTSENKWKTQTKHIRTANNTSPEIVRRHAVFGSISQNYRLYIYRP